MRRPYVKAKDPNELATTPKRTPVREWIRNMGSKGFTATELLMYITLAAVLAGSAVPFFLSIMETS
ncbi:MAG: Tfp pilus assembly protein FimT/FimU, partial [Candidatus Methylomirabilales bacterium]